MHIRLAILLTAAAAGCGRQDAAPPTTPVEAETAPPAAVWPPEVEPVGLPAVERGPLVIEPGGYQLGIVLPGSAHETHAVIRNSGPEPVAIHSARSTCMCTVPEGLEGAVIPPGGSHPFRVTFTAGQEPGNKDAKVWVKFQAGRQPHAALIKIEALISMAVRSDPPFVDALEGVTSGQLRVESMDGRPFRILSAFGRPPAHADGFDPGRDEPRTAYTLRWNIEYPDPDEADCSRARYWWVIETDHPECPVLPVEIRHDCTGAHRLRRARPQGWFFSEYLVNLGASRGGDPREVDVELQKLRDRKTLRVISVESLTSDATAELIEVTDTADSEFTNCRVRFTPRRDFEGLLYADVMFHTEAGDQDVAFMTRVLPGPP
jgi:hypothetical protein